jgi:branched-chain amino acid transport system permease protein
MALVLLGLLAPFLIGTRYWLTLGMQVWVLAAYAYSYQLLFGRAGMLSFGHAVYFGLGAFAAAHAMNSPSLRTAGFPAELIPLAGIAASVIAAIVFGYPSTRRAATPFAMVTLGIGEMVAACFLMFPGFFGGEMGITADRAALNGWLVASYARPATLYPLLAVWALSLIAAALWIARTPLGLLARAVRDNAERVGFLGFEPATVRFKVMLVSGPIAGGAGALAAMLFEIVSVESVSLHTSANVLLMTVVGGAASSIGPLVGALALTVMQTVLSKITHAWVFYYGLLFILVVLFAPNGLTDVVRSGRATWRNLGHRRFLAAYGASIAATLLGTIAGIVVVEVLFFRPEGTLDTPPLPRWTAGLAVVVLTGCCWLIAREHARRWGEVRP